MNPRRAGDIAARVLREDRGAIAVVRIDRPAKAHALTPEMLRELDGHLADIDADPRPRAVVISSTPAKVFSAGADVRRFARLDGPGMWGMWTRLGQQVFSRLEHLRQPTVAAIHGPAYGGGFELALSCDLRVCAEDATLTLPEVSLGTLPGWGGTVRLTRLVGPARAKALVFEARPLDAATALSWGAVDQLAPRAEVEQAAIALAGRIAERSPLAVQMAKQAIAAASPTCGGDAESLASGALAATTDAAEGLAALAERRTPTFLGPSTGPDWESSEA